MATTPTTDSLPNLAARLHQFFTRAKSFESGKRTDIALYRIFQLAPSNWQEHGLTPPEYSAVLVELARTANHLNEIEQQILDAKGERGAAFVKLLPTLTAALKIENFGAGWSEVANKITGEALVVLEIIANELPAERPVSAADLDQIKTEVRELMDIVRAAQIHGGLKKWLLQLLAEIEASINRYWFSGASAFRDAIVRGIGELSLYHEIFKQNEGKKNDVENVYTRFKSIMQRIIGVFRMTTLAIESGKDLKESLDSCIEGDAASNVGQVITDITSS